MTPTTVSFERVQNPTDAQIDSAVELFASLMKDDISLMSLCGGDSSKLGPLGRAMLRAGVHCGEYYEAHHESEGMVGFLMVTPPGQDLFSTDEQRALGLSAFMQNLPEAGKEYYKAVYLVEFPAFVNACLGPTGRRDSWYIHTLMVKSKFQGQGIGKALINIVRGKASLNGETLALSTTTDVNAVIYQRMGFQLLDKRIMPGPWGEYPLYILSMNTTIDTQLSHGTR